MLGLRHWTKKEDMQLKELLLDKKAYTTQEIANKLKITICSAEKRKERIFNSFTQKEKDNYKLLRRQATLATRRSNLKWTPEIIQKLKDAAESGLYDKIESLKNDLFPEDSVVMVRQLLSDHNIHFRSRKFEKHKGFTTESLDTPPSNITAKSYWELMEDASKDVIIDFKQESFHNINFDKPAYVGFTCIGDQHFGEAGIDYTQARKDAETIRDTDNMYALFGGDFFENYLKANIMSALVNKTSSPKQERMLLEHYFTFFGKDNEAIADKIVASISGNHDWRTADVSGIDLIRMMLKGKRILYSPEELRLTVNVNEIIYKVAARHMYRFNSTLNYTHTVKRWYDEGEETFDIGIIWHNHKPDTESFIKHNLMRWGIRPGSYKCVDRWAKGKGYPITLSLMPTFVMSPFERSIILFDHTEEASQYIKLKNAELKRR